MDTIVLILFSTLLVYGYLNLICRYAKLSRNNKKAKIIKKDKDIVNIIFVLILIWLATKVIREFGNSSFASWCTIFILETLYTIFISLNSKYVYICNESIIFADCAKNAKDYSYRINGDILEILPDKPPRKIETFHIEEDKDLLIDILKDYKSFE